jgi:acyl carrier protein
MVTRLSKREEGVLREIRQIALTQLHREPTLAPDDDLTAALELDSLTRVTLVVALEDRFRVALPDDELAEVRSLAELCRLVARLSPRELP